MLQSMRVGTRQQSCWYVCCAGVLGVPPAQLESPGFDTLLRLLTQPGEQAQELQQALLSALNTSEPSASAAAAEVAVGVVDQVAQGLAARAGLHVDVLFPMRRFMLQTANRAVPAAESSSSVSSLSSSSSSSQWSSSSGTGAAASMPATAAQVSSSDSSSTPGSSSSNGSNDGSPVLQEAAQVALAAAGSGSNVSKSNGRVLRMRQL